MGFILASRSEDGQKFRKAARGFATATAAICIKEMAQHADEKVDQHDPDAGIQEVAFDREQPQIYE